MLAIHANDHVEPVVHTSGMLEPLQIVDALRRGEVQVVEDTAALTTPMVIAAPVPATDVRSYVNVPLIAAGELLGILTVGSDQARVFTPAILRSLVRWPARSRSQYKTHACSPI